MCLPMVGGGTLFGALLFLLGDPKLPCRIIRRLANVLGDPLMSMMFMLEFRGEGEDAAAAAALAAATLASFNCSTAEGLVAAGTVFPALVRSNFLKSISVVFGAPSRSEQFCDKSKSATRPFCGSRRGVDRPELMGELTFDPKPPSLMCNFWRSSSASDTKGVAAAAATKAGFVGVDVLNDAVLRGSIGEIRCGESDVFTAERDCWDFGIGEK